MSIHLMSRVWTKDVSGATQTILLVLCDYANDDGVCWPSQATVAWKAGCTDRTVRNVIRNLEDRGAIIVRAPGQGRGHTSVLQINLGALPDKPEIISGIAIDHRKTVQIKPEIGASKPEIGASKPEIGASKPEIGASKPEIDDTKPETAISDEPLEPPTQPPVLTVISANTRKRRLPQQPIPEDWDLSESDADYAEARGLRYERLNQEAEKFYNYWKGRGELRADWSATWRTWVNNWQSGFGQRAAR